jgi:hypothetical protein
MVETIQDTQQPPSEFAKLSATINDYESGKIAATQATAAFHDELSQINNKPADLAQVQQSFSDIAKNSPLAPAQTDPIENPTYLPKEFPGLTLTDTHPSSDQSSITVTNPQNNRQVQLELRPGITDAEINQDLKTAQTDGINLTRQQLQQDNSFATPSVESAADLQNDKTKVYAEKVAATANDYFSGKINATTTNAEINQDIKDAKVAGVDLTNPSTYETTYGTDNFLTGVDLDGKVTFSDESKGGSQFVGINADPGNGKDLSLKRIELTGGQAQAQDVSNKVFLRTDGERALIGAGLVGLMGATASPVGAAIGAGIGAVGGAIEGEVKFSQHDDPNTAGMNIFNY